MCASGPSAGTASGGIGTASKVCCKPSFHEPGLNCTRTVGCPAGTTYSGVVPPRSIHGPHPAARFSVTVSRRVPTNTSPAGSSAAESANGAFHTLSGANNRTGSDGGDPCDGSS